MRFKNSPQLPGAGRTRAWHHHGSDTPISPRAIYVLKSANGGLFYTPLYLQLFMVCIQEQVSHDGFQIRNITSVITLTINTLR